MATLAIGFLILQRSDHMEPNERQNDDSFPGSNEMAGPSPDCMAYRAKTELVETLARLVLDSVAKTKQGDRHGEPKSETPRAGLGAGRT